MAVADRCTSSLPKARPTSGVDVLWDERPAGITHISRWRYYSTSPSSTSSLAVACHREAARCLMSVSSFNSTYNTSCTSSTSDLPLRTIQICSVFFCSSWWSMLAVINRIHWYVTVCAVNCTVAVAVVVRTAVVIDPIARNLSRIAIFAYPTCIPRPR